MKSPEQKVMKLGFTDGFRYIGFQPPLTEDEIRGLPLPVTEVGTKHVWEPTSIETHSDSLDIGFGNTPFQLGESFVEYAQRVAEYLGSYSLDSTIRVVGPGSVVEQASK